jgi:hypothetical protein
MKDICKGKHKVLNAKGPTRYACQMHPVMPLAAAPTLVAKEDGEGLAM